MVYLDDFLLAIVEEGAFHVHCIHSLQNVVCRSITEFNFKGKGTRKSNTFHGYIQISGFPDS